ncbi:hypothetical protein [Nesterenkonia rhizosphaerae]
MSKTGGGRGTNQYKIQGTSQVKKASSTAGESAVSLGGPAVSAPTWRDAEKSARADYLDLKRRFNEETPEGWTARDAAGNGAFVDFATAADSIELKGPRGVAYEIRQLHRNPAFIEGKDTLEDYESEFNTTEPVTEYWVAQSSASHWKVGKGPVQEQTVPSPGEAFSLVASDTEGFTITGGPSPVEREAASR